HAHRRVQTRRARHLVVHQRVHDGVRRPRRRRRCPRFRARRLPHRARTRRRCRRRLDGLRVARPDSHPRAAGDPHGAEGAGAGATRRARHRLRRRLVALRRPAAGRRARRRRQFEQPGAGWHAARRLRPRHRRALPHRLAGAGVERAIERLPAPHLAAAAARRRRIAARARRAFGDRLVRPPHLVPRSVHTHGFWPLDCLSVAESISITDNRTGEQFEIPISNGGINSADWRKALPDVLFYDPAFMVTAACESAITELDGEAGILRYRGYPIEELAENSTYLEVAYLLLNGELPNKVEYDAWVHDITHHTYIHENMRKR